MATISRQRAVAEQIFALTEPPKSAPSWEGRDNSPVEEMPVKTAGSISPHSKVQANARKRRMHVGDAINMLLEANAMDEERKVEIIDREFCYQGFFRLERVHLRHSLHRGGMSPVLVREIVEKGNVVGVLPYDPVRDTVVMIEQFRVGAIGGQRSGWLLEIVAGLMEPGELPEEVARREATEEAGLAVRRMESIALFYATPAKSSELTRLYCGEVDASGAGGVHGLAHEGEDIRVIPMPAEQAFGLLEAGRIDSAWPMIALMWLQTHRERLRQVWTEHANGQASTGGVLGND